MAEAKKPTANPFEIDSPSGGGASEAENPFEIDAPVESSALEKAGAFAEQAIGGLTQGSAIAGGAVMGGAIGGAITGPFAPLGALGGAVIGAGAGYMFGEGAKKATGIPGADDLPPDVRPYAVAGETFGQGIPAAGAVAGLARAGVRATSASGFGRFINRVLDYAGKRPGSFLAAETSSLGAASVAGGLSEAYFPSDPWARFGAEATAGAIAPTRHMIGAARNAADIVTRFVSTVAPTGRQNRAAQILQDAVRMGGDDPDAVAALLAHPDPLGLEMTAGQKSGSAGLIALESALAQDSARFGAEQKKVATSALATLRNTVDLLRATNDPNALAVAAEIRSMQIRTLIQGRVQKVEEEAYNAARAISADEPRARADLSRLASGLAKESLEEMRDIERQLWKEVPKLAPIQTNGIIQAYGRLRTELLPEEKLSPIIEDFVSRMRSQDLLTDAGEVIRFRSRALKLAREASSQQRFTDARAFGQLAEAALDDLAQLSGKGNEAYTTARTFSRELHDAFTRSFGGDALATDRAGALRIPPEMLLERAMGSGGTGADVRLGDLEELSSFLTRQGSSSPEAASRFGQMLQAQERIISLAAKDGLDPNTGRANVGKLGKFLRDNQGLLDRFPEVRERVQGAIDMETRASRVREAASRATKAIEKGTAFAKIEKMESTVDAIRTAIASKSPDADLTAMARLAKRGGDPAIQGLRASVIEHAAAKATTADGDFSFTRFKTALDEPVRPGAPSLSQVMQSEGILDAGSRARLDKVLEKAVAIETSIRKGINVDEILKNNPDALVEMVLRTAGAKLGSAVSNATGGSANSLIAASAGSKFMRQTFDRFDKVSVMKLLQDAARDPKLAAALLERPTSQAGQIRLARSIHAYLISASLSAADSDGDSQQ